MNKTLVLALAVLALAGLSGVLAATTGSGRGSDGCCPMAGCGACPAPAQAAAEGVVNDHCPIMGTKIDPAKVPANLTREFKGQKVGFCCAPCIDAWDKLTDAQKDEKLQKAMGK